MILHANWVVDSAVMAFWIEGDPVDSALGPARASGLGDAPPHPFSHAAEKVVANLPKRLEPFTDDRTILLPTSGAAPVASASAVPENARLAPWLIETAEVLGESFLEYTFHHDIDDWKDQCPSLQWGNTMDFWCELARFGRQLYERQYYAPGLTRLEGKLYPAWQAVLNDQAEKQWRRLIEATPPLCRAVVDPASPQQDSPHRLVLSFIDTCVDFLARRRIMRRAPRQVPLRRSSSAPHRQWLNTLRWGHFQSLHCAPTTMQQFSADVDGWIDYLRPTSLDTPWRLGFEMEAPDDELRPWRVDFVLTSVKSADQRLTAVQVWSASAANQYIPTAREVLLTGLGRACQVFPQLRRCLIDTEPVSCELDREEASSFMLEIGPKLRRLGFHTKFPNWWGTGQESLGLRLRIDGIGGEAQDRPSFLGVGQLVDYHWEIALGDQVLDEEEFRQLAQSKQGLVFRNGRWMSVDVDALNKSMVFIDEQGNQGQKKLSQILKLGKKLEKDGGLRLLDVDIGEEVTEFNSKLQPGQVFKPLAQPEAFQGFMPPYQIHGFSWMIFIKGLRLGACLADDMGLGKTIQMIAVLLYEREQEGEHGPTLIVSPMSVVGNWVRELKRFSPCLKVMVHHGSERRGEEEFLENVNEYDVVISTYNLVVRDQSAFKTCDWHNIVLDEAQNIKNPNTKQSTIIRAMKSRHRYCLTGTPIENRLTELWSLMDFLNPGYLGPLAGFRSTFSQPIERDQDQTRARILQKVIRPFILRRLKSDKDIIRDLPEKHEMKVFCNLTTEQATLYQAVVDNMMTRIRESQGIERKGIVLSTLTKLKQITNHPVHYLRDNSAFTAERSGKLQRLEEMLDVVLEGNDRALIFSQFTEIGNAMREKLQNRFGEEVLYMHGGTPKQKRDEMIARFQNPHGPPIFLLSLKAGGVGLNLTAANHVFHFDRWWNPAIEDQATDRTYRIGQTKNVQVHKFICIGTVEEKIDQMIEEKKRLADNIVSAGERMLTELSTDDLQEVFSLTRDAVVE